MDMVREMETVIAAKKLEFQIMSIIPIGILLYMKLGFGEFLDILYGNIVGATLMTICLFAYLLIYMAGRKIVNMEV